jgi:UDP-glucuronate 4-epimerase
MEVVALRFFTVYGPRQRPDLAIRKFAHAITRGEPIDLFGDGSTRRDYTYIDDILQGVLAALDRRLGYEVINLGESRTVALRELVELLERNLGRKAVVRWLPVQPGDVPVTFADIGKARRLLGYNPQVPIEEGIARFVAWFKQGQ